VLAPLELNDVAGSSPTRFTASRSARGHWRSLCRRRPAAILSSRSILYCVADEGACSHSTQSRQRGNWNIDRIRAKSYTDNGGGSYGGEAEAVVFTTQETLKQLAC